MKVLFDTNVILDALTLRDYDYKDSQELIRNVLLGKIIGYVSAKQITDIYYILKKYMHDEDKIRESIKLVLASFEVLPTTKSDLSYCLNSSIKDYEDAVIDEAARVNCINYIVTHNIKDFENSKAIVMTPNEMIKLVSIM